jgi:hypothetical protein
MYISAMPPTMTATLPLCSSCRTKTHTHTHTHTQQRRACRAHGVVAPPRAAAAATASCRRGSTTQHTHTHTHTPKAHTHTHTHTHTAAHPLEVAGRGLHGAQPRGEVAPEGDGEHAAGRERKDRKGRPDDLAQRAWARACFGVRRRCGVVWWCVVVRGGVWWRVVVCVRGRCDGPRVQGWCTAPPKQPTSHARTRLLLPWTPQSAPARAHTHTHTCDEFADGEHAVGELDKDVVLGGVQGSLVQVAVLKVVAPCLEHVRPARHERIVVDAACVGE